MPRTLLKIVPEFDHDELARKMRGEAPNVVADAMSNASKDIAEAARRRMSDMLKPGHQYNVGWTGRASQNLFVEKGAADRRNCKYEFLVVEGDNTYANWAIRTGIRPHTAPSIPELRAWMSKAGPVRVGKLEGRYGRVRAHTRRTPSGGTVQVSEYAKKVAGKKSVKGVVYAVQQAIWESGSNRPTANWMKLPPTGQGRFDYVMWTMKQTGMFEQQIMDNEGKVIEIIAEWLLSGRKKGWGKRVYY